MSIHDDDGFSLLLFWMQTYSDLLVSLPHTISFALQNKKLELAILETVDTCAPLTDVKINRNNGVTNLPSSIKHKLNLRKRLLKIDRMRSSCVNAPRIRSLNIELKSFFSGAKATSVRRTTMGSKFNLWKAVKKAKNLNVDSIPNNLTLGGRGASR